MVIRPALIAAAVVAAGLTAATGFVAVTATDADAASCRPRLTGSGNGQGILGKGSQRARAAATADWEGRAKAAYGWRFAKLSRASDVVWDCKSLPLQAKCTVTAKPCRR